jgi:hypothetical protein
MGDRWINLIALMLANPPDPTEKLPLSNQKGTILGTTLTFLAIALSTASFRLYVRVFVVHEPGWDDIFLVLSAACGTVGTTYICISTLHGLGDHFLYLGVEEMAHYLRVWIVPSFRSRRSL